MSANVKKGIGQQKPQHLQANGMNSIGQTLRQARENRNVSLEDASRVTKIKLDILHYLETDDFDHLAGPMYAKSFLKLYSEYLGLDSQAVVDSYLHSQGGLRRQGLHVETEAKIRARKPPELKLPLQRIVWVVVVASLAVALIYLAKSLWPKHAPAPPVTATQSQKPPTPPAPLPKADFEPYYEPRTKPAAEILEPPK